MNLLKNKYFILGNILLLLAIIPITLFVVKQQTDLRSKAAPSTNLSFTPSTISTSVGQTFTLDVYIDPGQNQVSIVDQMTIRVDPDKLDIVSLAKNDVAFPVTLVDPTINANGTASLSMSVSASDITQVIQTKTKIATVTFKAKAGTNGAASIVKFDVPPTQVFSTAGADGQTENVLSGTGTASVTIAGSSSTTTVKPQCTSLNLDRASAGTTPFSVTFTAIGSSSNATISKVSFNFGDSPVQDVTTAGGIGTNSVNVQIAHTYTNPGTYPATAILTDSNGGVSDVGSCTKSITVTTAGSGGGIGNAGGGNNNASSSAQISPTAIPLAVNPTAVPQVTAAPTLPITGTLETTLAILGVVGTAIGIGIFLFVL